nr:TPA_asm: FtsK [Astyanax tetra cavefish adintovirus]
MVIPNSFDARLQLPFSCIVCGPSNSGKSFFIKTLLENCAVSMSKIPDQIVWCYSCWQPLYDELMNVVNIRFVQGIPDSLCDDNIFPPHTSSLVIFDDLMLSASNNLEVQNAFTKYTHHRNLSVIYLVQNLFFQGKSSRTINLNTNYMVLFKNPRDKLQISVLARQMYPGNGKFMLECFQDATARPYGYLFVDLKASTPEELRLRSGLFSWENPAVYIPKKKVF